MKRFTQLQLEVKELINKKIQLNKQANNIEHKIDQKLNEMEKIAFNKRKQLH